MRRLPLALAPLAIATLASPALADCPPGAPLCAAAGVSVPAVQVGGEISFGVPQVAVPAPPVVVQAPPPPQAYGYYPPPPPSAYYAPRAPRYYAPPPPMWGVGKLGLDVHVDGAAGFGSNLHGNVYGAGGIGLGLRYHAMPHLGFELDVDYLGGTDWQDRHTNAIAGNAGMNFYFNPRSRAQLYLSGGFLVDHTSTSTQGAFTDVSAAVSNSGFTHLGGYGGLGLELFVTRRLAFHLDARAVVRQNVSGDGPEFTNPTTGQSTNTSAGFVGQGGLVFYF